MLNVLKESNIYTKNSKPIFLNILFTFIILLSSPAFARTFYVDLDGGNDSNGGASTEDAWLNLPGTCTTGSSGTGGCSWLSNNWESINAGDTIKIKSGTTHSSGDGGRIYFTSAFYATNATTSNYITIERDTTWGTGAITFDGSSISLPGSGWGLFLSRVGGLKFDGKTTDGFVVRDSSRCGISIYPSSGAIQASSFYYMYFYNNGTAYASSENASDGQIKILATTNGGVIDNVNLNGNGNRFQGVSMGESGDRIIGYTISNVTAYNHYGTASYTCSGSNDGGIAFKAQNSQVTLDNVTAYNNCKGVDMGEQNSKSAWEIIYTVKNSLFYSNDYGVNFSNASGGSVPTATYYLINNIFRDNDTFGSHVYGGPFTHHVVHNVFDNNGNGWDEGNLQVGNDCCAGTEDSTTNIHFYNNIFYKPGGSQNYVVYAHRTESDYNLDSDYNSWVQRASEDAVYYGAYGQSQCKEQYDYGSSTGPGNTGSTWYREYACSTSPPAKGTGHYRADGNSVGTGAVDSTLPPFTNVSGHDYTLTAPYTGTNISGKIWYISAMGTDKDGVARTNWDMGAYEYNGDSNLSAPRNLRVVMTP